MKILVAEDDPHLRSLLSTTLKRWDHEVVLAEDGNQALKFFRADHEIQMAIVDWMMPGMEGVVLCSRIKSEEKRNFTYIIMLTVKNESEEMAHAFQMGVDDYITKPFDPVELESRIKAGERIVCLETSLKKKIAELESSLELVQEKEWMRVERNFGKFLYRSFSLIDDYLKTVDQVSSITIPELYQCLLQDLMEKKIFEGENITFMAPIREENQERLVVVASTKKTTNEGDNMVGQRCGSTANQAFFQDEIWKVEIIKNKENNGQTGGKYEGKSYLYPIIDLDSQSGSPNKYALIGIANIPQRQLPDSYVDLLKNMGNALGRQFGRVLDRQRAQVKLKKINEELTFKTKELKRALFDVEKRCKQVELQSFLFGAINHDFKRALIAVMAQTESLSKNAAENAKPSLLRINHSISDALELVNVIDKLEKTHNEEIPVHHFLEEYRKKGEYLSLIKKKKNDVQVTWDLAAEERIFFDSMQFQRVMNNLVSNAIKYNSIGGEVHIASEVVADSVSRTLEITVSDQGLGINREDLAENIFRSHWRSCLAKASAIDGTGMGLSFVKYLMDKCGGSIKVESRPGRTNKAGVPFVTTFILSFKAFSSQLVKETENALEKSRRVLVIAERDPGNQYDKGIQHLLEDLEEGLGAKYFEYMADSKEAMRHISDYGIVVFRGAPEMNKPVVLAAKEAHSTAVCLNDEKGEVHVITKEKDWHVPTESFLMVVSDLIN